MNFNETCEDAVVREIRWRLVPLGLAWQGRDGLGDPELRAAGRGLHAGFGEPLGLYRHVEIRPIFHPISSYFILSRPISTGYMAELAPHCHAEDAKNMEPVGRPSAGHVLDLLD